MDRNGERERQKGGGGGGEGEIEGDTMDSQGVGLVGCSTSQQHASVSQGRICTILRAATLR